MSTVAPPVAPAPRRLSSPPGGPLRSQLPVHSPLTLGAVMAGLRESIGSAGRALAELEQFLLQRYAADRAVLCGSGTDALQVAIRIALRSSGGDGVALPAFSCFDVAAAARGAGARVCFYDIDPETLGPERASFRDALGRVGVAVVSPLYGIPVDWAEVERIRSQTGGLIIEDAAQGAGARWQGQLVGSLGTISVLSFGRGKGWTGGGGGALLLRGLERVDPEILAAESARSSVGIVCGALAQLALGRPGIYRVPLAIPGLALGETVWHDPRPPRRMAAAAARIALANAELADREQTIRTANARALLARIPLVPGMTPVRIPAGGEATYLRLPFLVDGGIPALGEPDVVRRLGIAPSYPLPLHELPQLAGTRLDPAADHPGATRLARDLVTLPTHSCVTDADMIHMLRVCDRGMKA